MGEMKGMGTEHWPMKTSTISRHLLTIHRGYSKSILGKDDSIQNGFPT